MKAGICIAAAGLFVAHEAGAQQPLVTGSHAIELHRSSRDSNLPGAVNASSPFRAQEVVDMAYAWGAETPVKWLFEFKLTADDRSAASRGVTLDRIGMRHVNGEAEIPYRVEAGDVSAVITGRTHSRGLKGAFVEIQPQFAGLLHSLVAFAGKSSSEWLDLRAGEDRSAGLSWLGQGPGDTGWRTGAHLVQNTLAAQADAHAPQRRQLVGSLTAARPFRLGGWVGYWEGEWAALRGEAREPATATIPSRRRENAAYSSFDAAHASSGISGSLRFDRNGPGYRTYTDVVTADWRQHDAKVMWARAGSSAQIDWSAVREEAWSTQPRVQRHAGFSAGTAIPWPGGRIRAAAWRDNTTRIGGTEDRTAEHGEVKLSGQWGTLTGTLHDEQDRLAPERDSRRRAVSLTTAHAALWQGWKIDVNPAFTWQRVRGASGETGQWIAGGDITLAQGPHRLTLNYKGDETRLVPETSPDVERIDAGAAYTYKLGRHTVSLQYVRTTLRPAPGRRSHDNETRLGWTVNLDHVPSRGEPRASTLVPLEEAFVRSITRDLGVLEAIPLGTASAVVLADVARHFGSARQFDNGLLYSDVRVLLDVPGEQQLALVLDPDRKVSTVALLFSVGDNPSPTEVSRAYDRALRAMVQRYGRPDRLRQEGAFLPTLANDLRLGRLVRYAQWDLAASTVRLGIPRRFDGTSRIEIHRTATRSSLEDGAWGLESFR